MCRLLFKGRYGGGRQRQGDRESAVQQGRDNFRHSEEDRKKKRAEQNGMEYNRTQKNAKERKTELFRLGCYGCYTVLFAVKRRREKGKKKKIIVFTPRVARCHSVRAIVVS